MGFMIGFVIGLVLVGPALAGLAIAIAERER